jgi:WD40 repeat protein
MTAISQLDLPEVFDRLAPQNFQVLRKLLGDGKPLAEFVDVMFAECAKNDPSIADEQRSIPFRRNLESLFTVIDVNANGDVSWEEFSHFFLHSYRDESDNKYKDIVDVLAFEPKGVAPTAVNRSTRSLMEFAPEWDCFILLENGVRSSDLVVYKRHFSEFEPRRKHLLQHAVYKTDHQLESMCYVNRLSSICCTTGNDKLKFFRVTNDVALADAHMLQEVYQFREHHLEGRHSVLRYDPETHFLFAGNTSGEVICIDIVDDTRVLPLVTQRVRLHSQPVIDVCVLPLRGNKKLLSSGLDGKLQVMELTRAELFGELGHNIHAHGMSFCDEYSMLVTCSKIDRDALVWAPHAARAKFVGRLSCAQSSSAPTAQLVEVNCIPESPYCFVGDSNGVIHLFDLRKQNQVVAFYADGDPLETEKNSYLTLKSFAVDRRNLDIVSCCKGEKGTHAFITRAIHMASRDPLTAHDDSVVAFAVAKLECRNVFVTASADALKVWDPTTGAVTHHLVKFFDGEKDAPRRIISVLLMDPSGRKFFLGTVCGSVTMHSTATCGCIGECVVHDVEVVRLFRFGDLLFSCATDGSIHACNVSGDSPAHLFALRRELFIECHYFAATERLGLIAAGSKDGSVLFYDFSDHHGAHISQVKQFNDIASEDKDDVVRYMLPMHAEVTAISFCGSRPAVCVGDCKGNLSIITTRPHVVAWTRFCRWKNFFLKANQAFFAVALDVVWKEDCELIVADDQGQVVIWDCREVFEAYKLTPTVYPVPSQLLHTLVKPSDPPFFFEPKLKAFFSVSNGTPIRSLTLIHNAALGLVVDRAVCLYGLEGHFFGELQQGRMTAMGHLCGRYMFDVSLLHDVIPNADETSTVTAQTTAAVVDAFENFDRFVLVSAEDYNAMSTEKGKPATGHSGRFRVAEEQMEPAPSRPPSPSNIRELRSKLSAPLPRPISRRTLLSADVKASSSRASSTLRKTDMLKVMQSQPMEEQVESVHDAQLVLNRAADLLQGMTAQLPIPTCPSIIMFNRAYPERFNTPSLEAIYSSEMSFSIDWATELFRKPHRQRWINGLVLNFQAHVQTVPKQGPTAPTLPSLLQKNRQQSCAEDALPASDYCGESNKQSATLYEKLVLFQEGKKYGPARRWNSEVFHETQKQSNPDQEASPLRGAFSFAPPGTLPTSHEAILKSIQEKLLREEDRRRCTDQIMRERPSSPSLFVRRKFSLIPMYEESKRPPSPRVCSTTPDLRQPFAQSATTKRVVHPASWQSAEKALSRRRGSCSPSHIGPDSRPLSRGTSHPGASLVDRRDYVQFLLHLPRIKEIIDAKLHHQ